MHGHMNVKKKCIMLCPNNMLGARMKGDTVTAEVDQCH